jgi:biotin transport system substrate-specific component
MTQNRLGNTRSVILMAEMTALTAICSQIILPLPFTPIPLNLALLAVFLCGGLLGAKRAALSMLAYLLLGTFGVPVFSAMRSGPGMLLGPTGGFLMGYLAAAFLTGLLSAKAEKDVMGYVLPMGIGLAVCYVFGTAWFMILTKRTFTEALLLCVIPFIPGDALKIAVAAILSSRLKQFVNRDVMMD